MNNQSKIAELESKLVVLKAKESRTGGSRSQTLEILSVRHQIKDLKNNEAK